MCGSGLPILVNCKLAVCRHSDRKEGGHCAWVECFTIVGHACCDLNSEYRMSYNLDNIMSLKYD